MSPTNCTPYPHLSRMLEIERELRKTAFWKFSTKRKLKQEYRDLQQYGFFLGLKIGLNDLEKCGLIKLIKQ